MAHDVYVVGLFDDYMTYWLLEKAEYERINRRQMQDMDFTPFITWELLEYSMSPEEFAEYRAENEGELEASIEDSFDFMQLLQMVKDGKINIIEVAEGLQM